ncbi:phage N-6-adenine-methyltransferase [Xenorhabdus bovienii]|uniref:phage N-6-adenine-methyltransferase n=1 Tax=Xenorhabdus bovienii TaxID=40576 RepID=UPI0023B2328A|nr:phage N-6-adenine-methyltransferase [Xenorhabdus bovienii]MDE9454613.1 phage N-6-adenine-methyltransferase [Xenorhabdus bovienii]MDE9494397.1 phage N-6-adenine-methyltransferase [Xenorhabdus bovienii]MDE9502836.1 phage N-6-adenine-methyltransferase [Xenorhabdus bovienii]MDE9526451.1 phage N-6-adenine-methyltransferase [Xenorhabdus bovienii]MDE9568758.1 phage N-6-adenine-methyltransferase [Xenorhabdus bovienii]
MLAIKTGSKLKRDKSLKDFWRTPQWFVQATQIALSIEFNVDVACNKDNALFPQFIGVEKDALKCSWGESGTKAFLNPPYSKIEPWIDAAIHEQSHGVTTVMLIPQSIDTKWYLKARKFANEVVLIIGGRIAFLEPNMSLGFKESRENTGGSMLMVFRGNSGGVGCVVREIPITTMKEIGGYVPPVRAKRTAKTKLKKEVTAV